MRDYVITVNSTVDLPKEWLKERHVPVVPLRYTIDGRTYTDMEGLSAKEFFAKLREVKMSVTSQVNPEEAVEALEPYVKEGRDVIFLGISEDMSTTCNVMRMAARELETDRVFVIDSMNLSTGIGLQVLRAAQALEKAGKEGLSPLLDALTEALGERLLQGGDRRRLMRAVELVRQLRQAAQFNANPGQLAGWLCAGLFLGDRN